MKKRAVINISLEAKSGISASHIGRIERGQRFPSALILHKIAKPLGFEESELFTCAGYMSPQSPIMAETGGGRVDPYVAAMLSQEPVEVQRAVIGILAILKSMAKVGVNIDLIYLAANTRLVISADDLDKARTAV